jgi:hypothetical protein
MRWISLSALPLGSLPGVAAAQSQFADEPSVANEQHQNVPDSAMLTSSRDVAAQVPAAERASAVVERQHEPHPWRARPFAIDALIGIASPVGVAGLAIDYAPVEALSLSAGAGTNLFGWQISGMLRWRFNPERRTSLSLGAGYSQGAHHQARGTQDGVFSVLTGPLSSMGEDNLQERDWRVARWLNVELGVERREERGVDARGFAGVAFLLDPDDNALAPPQDQYDRPIEVRAFMVYLGGAFGYAL